MHECRTEISTLDNDLGDREFNVLRVTTEALLWIAYALFFVGVASVVLSV